jgi:A/G-specific adenine glycosylase
MEIPADTIHSFQSMIFSWWDTNRRDLPWRYTHDPYKILVSELMLQQTQVSRVLPKYQEFLILFPDVFTLSKSSSADVLKAWKGMGYNRRALYLKKMAEIIVQKYNGTFPKQEKELLLLPGLGKYTARALLVFAYKQNVTMIDTNIRQIITHFFFYDVKQPEIDIQSVADQLLPKGKSWEWHQALMDYGAIKLPSVIPDKPAKRGAIRDPKYVTQSKLPFRQTNRFFRGRIIDALRERSYQEVEFLSVLAHTYEKDTAFLRDILTGLERDGLIERSKTGIISLPK